MRLSDPRNGEWEREAAWRTLYGSSSRVEDDSRVQRGRGIVSHEQTTVLLGTSKKSQLNLRLNYRSRSKSVSRSSADPEEMLARCMCTVIHRLRLQGVDL